MISVQLAPLEITIPEYLAVRYNGVTQLRQNSNFYIFSLQNMMFAMSSRMLVGVYTFSKIMTVLFLHDEFKKTKNMLQSSSSMSIWFQPTFSGLASTLLMALGLKVFLGTLSPTSPTLIHSAPIQMMMSSLRLILYMSIWDNYQFKILGQIMSCQIFISQYQSETYSTYPKVLQHTLTKQNKLKRQNLMKRSETKLQKQCADFQDALSNLKDDQMTAKSMNLLIKQLMSSSQQSTKDIIKLKKELQLRPTLISLTENTVLTTKSIFQDPSLIKLLTPGRGVPLDDQSENDHHRQLRQASGKLGCKISQISEIQSILFDIIKNMEKSFNSEFSKITSLIQERATSLLDQFNLFKDQQTSEQLQINQKLEFNHSQAAEKIRHCQIKANSQIKQLKSKLDEKVNNDVFSQQVDRLLLQSSRQIQKFQNESESLVNPSKIRELQSSIQQIKQKFSKQLTSCDFSIQIIKQTMAVDVVKHDFFDKQRIAIEKRQSNLNTNFQQLLQKTIKLIDQSVNHQIKIQKLEKNSQTLQKSVQKLGTFHQNLHLSGVPQSQKRDPDKIVELEKKIEKLQFSGKQLQLQIISQQQAIDRMQTDTKSGVTLIPNQQRQKICDKRDIKEAIDFYFIQNKFACKINSIHSELNQFKSDSEAIKTLKTKVSRLQKESQFGEVRMKVANLEHYFKGEINELSQKIKEVQTKIKQTKEKISSANENSNQSVFRSSINRHQKRDSSFNRSHQNQDLRLIVDTSRKSLRKRTGSSTSQLNQIFNKNLNANNPRNQSKPANILVFK